MAPPPPAPAPSPPAAPPRPADLAVVQLLVRGRHLWNKRTEQSLRAALGCFQEVIDRDPMQGKAWIGIATHKHKYIAKFLGPAFGKNHIRWGAPFFFVLELPLDLARMLTLALRLLANMFADHTVVGVWLSLVPIGVPAVFMGLGLVISFLQAFVFALLTMIYIGLALEEPH